MTPTINII